MGLAIAALSVVGYFYLLQLLIAPYMKGLDQTLQRIAEKQKARIELGLSMPREEREELLNQRFGKLPTDNEVNIQKRVALGWHKFCVLAFAAIALMTLVHYVWQKDKAGFGHLARHLTALPAFAFALPLLFFNQQAQRFIKPISAVFSILFFGTVIATALRARKKKSQ